MGLETSVVGTEVVPVEPQPVGVSIDIGLQRLESWGVDLDRVAGIQLRGPKAECVGTFAEALGRPEHKEWAEQIGVAIAEGVTDGSSPTETVMAGLRMNAMRDEAGKIMKEDLETLKKNRATSGSQQAS